MSSDITSSLPFGYLTYSLIPITQSKDEDISDDIKMKNQEVCNHILLAMNEPDSLEVVLSATTKGFSNNEDKECGDAHLAWKLLKDK
jgi:hypothetical protein